MIELKSKDKVTLTNGSFATIIKELGRGGQGIVYLTNKNLIFHSQEKGLKISFSKIVGISPYSDGIDVHRDGNNQKRITMQGFDPWFLMNLLSQINNI